MSNIEGITSISYAFSISSIAHILLKIKDCLDTLSIPFWLAWGTCLGAVRDGGVLPWHKDIDLGCVLEVNRKKREAISRQLYKVGFASLWEIKDSGSSWGSLSVFGPFRVEVEFELRSLSTYTASVRIDGTSASLTCYKCEDTLQMEGVNGFIPFPARLFNNLQTVEFLGHKFCVPNPPDEYLRIAYGKDWTIPKKEGWEDDWRN